MAHENKIYGHFANLVSYPELTIQEDADGLVAALTGQRVDKLVQFAEHVRHSIHSDIEELFTRTFDLNPACCLEVGWHLFGEDYRRGEFLVQMRESLAEEGIIENGELPDHLSHGLHLLTRLEPEDAREFTKSYLLPAIAKILQAFDADETNPYQGIIEVLQMVLKRNYDIRDAEVPHPALRVLNNAPQFHTNSKASFTG